MKIVEGKKTGGIDWSKVRDRDIIRHTNGRLHQVVDHTPWDSLDAVWTRGLMERPGSNTDYRKKSDFIAHYPNAELHLGDPA